MARHWSSYTRGVTERQAMALDKMARQHGLGNGLKLLAEVAGCREYRISNMDRVSLRPYIDEAFERYGRPPAPKPPVKPSADLSAVPAEALLAELRRRGLPTDLPREEEEE